MKRSLSLSLVALAWALSSYAQAAYTLEQAYDLATKKSEDLTIGQLEIERQEQSAEAIKTQVRPRAQLGGNLSRVFSKVGSAGIHGDWQPTFRTELRQPLYEGGTTKAQLQSVEYSTNAARWDLEAQKENLFLEVAQLFYQIIARDQDINNLKESERIYRDRVATLEGRARIGKSRNAEVLAAKTQLESVSAQIKASAAVRDVAQRRLAWLTGQNAPMYLVDRLTLETLTLNTNNQKLLPTVQAARARVALAESRIEEARTVNRPQVDALAAYDWHYPYPDGDQVNQLSFGVGLTWTFFDAGQVKANVGNATIARNQASVNEALQARENRLARDQAEQSFRDGLEQVRLYDKALDAAERNVKIQQQEFENGLLTNLEVMASLDSRLQIKRSRDQAVYETKLSYVEAQLQIRGLPKTGTP